MPRISNLPPTAFPTLDAMFPVSFGTETNYYTLAQVRALMDFQASEITYGVGVTVAQAISTLQTGKVEVSDYDIAIAALSATDATKAPLASPVFTGNPQAPTPSVGDNDTSVATTAFVRAEIADRAIPVSGATMTGPLTIDAAGTSQHLTLEATNANQTVYLAFNSTTSVRKGFLGYGTPASATQMQLYNEAGGGIEFSSGAENTMNQALQIHTSIARKLILKGTANGNPMTAMLSFEDDNNTERGHFGYSSGSSQDMRAQAIGGALELVGETGVQVYTGVGPAYNNATFLSNGYSTLGITTSAFATAGSGFIFNPAGDVTIKKTASGAVAAFSVSAGTHTAFCGSITVTTTTTAYNTSSDYRLKSQITPLVEFELDLAAFEVLPDAVLRILALRPVSHNWIANPERFDHGFIAHELQQIIPHAVTGVKDGVSDIGIATHGDEVIENIPQAEVADGWEWKKTGTRPEYQGVDNSKLVPDLVSAVQQLSLLVVRLEARIAELETA